MEKDNVSACDLVQDLSDITTSCLQYGAYEYFDCSSQFGSHFTAGQMRFQCECADLDPVLYMYQLLCFC